ncbi:MAG: glycosyltransferase [Bacteroides sp.]|nr:glycosyltransferase [Barnesiella sp.]MBD5343986.1 glycosyltransferase [Bacteroides sp.]MBD5369275.1 glycosyltransferase [Bacteroides sp.]
MTISIITATRNSGKTVKDTFESVLAQSYDDYEYIVVDGASEDNTLDIVRAYEPRFNGRMKWISEPDDGIYHAMNKGISMATGDVIGILNSDDFYSSTDILATVAREIADVDAVYGDIHYVLPNDLSKPVRVYSSKSFSRWMMRFGFMPAHPSFYCWRRIYDDFGLYDQSFEVASDFEFLLRAIFLHNISTRYLPIDFVTMRKGGASTSGFSSHKRILKDHLRAYKKNGVSSSIFHEAFRYFYKFCEVNLFRLRQKLRKSGR